MQVSLTLVGILQDYYPQAAGANGVTATVDTEEGTTVRAMLDAAGIPDEEEYFIMLNGSLLESADAARRCVALGDEFVLAPVIKGG